MPSPSTFPSGSEQHGSIPEEPKRIKTLHAFWRDDSSCKVTYPNVVVVTSYVWWWNDDKVRPCIAGRLEEHLRQAILVTTSLNTSADCILVILCDMCVCFLFLF